MIKSLFGGEVSLPLSKAKLYECFKNYQEGDLSARETIIKCNIRLVISEVIRRFSQTGYEDEDLLSIGLIGLIKGVDTFDINKNYEFATYAIRCIDNEILMFLRKGKKSCNDISLEDDVKCDDSGYALKIADLISDINSDIELNHENKETHEIVRKILTTLPTREKEIIMLHFGFIGDKMYTQQEIALKLNLSQAQISRIIKKTLNNIKKILTSDDDIKVDSHLSNVGLSNFESKEGEKNMGKKLKSIYEYFKDYSETEIDSMLLKLTDGEKELIGLRYGDNLHQPQTDETWTRDNNDTFYGTLVPKMKRLLANQMNKGRTNNQNSESICGINPEHESDDSIGDVLKKSELQKSCKKESKMVDESNNLSNNSTNNWSSYINSDFLEMIKQTSILDEVIQKLSAKEGVIAYLIFGYIDNKYFSLESLAQFLSIHEDEVKEITKKVLLAYKDSVNQSIDQVIDTIENIKIKQLKK